MKITDSFRRLLSRKSARRPCRPRLELLESRITPTGHDTLMTALTPALDGSPTAGTLADRNQVDLYVIQPVQAGDELTADLSAPNGGGPGDALRLFDANGKQLAFQENPGPGPDTPTLTFDAVAAGTYYLGVSSDGDYTYVPTVANSGNGGLAQGDYTLTLNLNSGAFLATESPPNFSPATAQVISGNVDQSISGQSVLQGSYAVGNTEYYKFTAIQSGGLAAVVTPDEAATFVPRLALYSGAGQLLIQTDAGADGTARLNQNLQVGTYYLGVSAVTDPGNPPGDLNYNLATTFQPAQPLFQPLDAGAANPVSVAVGDFNHDGNLDFVTANYSDNTVSVLLGNGDGSFQDAATYNTGAGPNSVAVGDFNHDGNLDLVTANYSDNTVSVLLGNGDGTFQTAVPYAVGNNPRVVALAEFNGHLDIFTANAGFDTTTNTYGPGTVSVLQGNDDGTFQQTATTYAVGVGASAVAVGDWGGGIDIVAANAGDNTVSVLRESGGSLLPAVTYRVGNSPRAVAVGDFNGRLGFVIANFGDNTASVLLVNPDGTLQPAVSYSVGVQPSGVAVADVNGQAEIVVANAYSNSVSVLRGDGAGGFQPAVAYPLSHKPLAVALGDFNNDGRLDIVAADNLDGKASVLLGQDNGTFTSPVSALAVGQTPLDIAVGVLNRDGAADIVTANGGDNTVSVLLGNDDGTFQTAVAYAAGDNPASVALGDFNRDGNLDLVVADYLSNTVSVLLGRGDGTFLPAASYSVGAGPIYLAVGDFNGDGHLDIVTANYLSNTVSVLLGDGAGGFGAASVYSVGVHPGSVAVGYFNGDGHLDIVTANAGDNTVSVLRGDGHGGFQAAVAYAVGLNPQAVAVGDFNSRPDIVTANSGYDKTTKTYGPGTVSVLLGDGTGGFLPAVAYAVGNQPSAVAVGDFNGDGNFDIVASDSTDKAVSVLLGEGGGAFQPALDETVGEDPYGVAVGDFNNDGNLDIATANRGDNSVSVLLGSGRAPFQAPATYSAGNTPDAVAVDNDNNSNDVIFTADRTQGTVSALLGNADDTAFQTPAATYAAGPDPVALALSNDTHGNIDVFVANQQASTVSVLLGDSVDHFGSPTPYSVTDSFGNGVGPVAVAVGSDAQNNDVVATADSDGYVSVLVGNADGGGFGAATTYQVGSDPVAVAVANDSNGNVDIFVADYLDGTVTVLLGDANDNFTLGGVYQLDPGLDAVAVGYDNNQNDILAVANALTNQVSVLVGNADGTDFPTVATFAVGNHPDAVAVGSDSSNNADVVAANYADGTASVLLGDANDNFQTAAAYKVGPHPVGIDVSNDLNGNNGNLNIFTANAGNGTVSVLLGNTSFYPSTPQNAVAIRHVPFLANLNGNPLPDELVLDGAGRLLFRQSVGASGVFSPPAVLNPGHPARDATVFRTADGWAVAAIDVTGNTVSLYTWDAAAGSFVRTVGFATGNTPVRIAAHDLTGDGLDDLVVTNAIDDTVTIAFQTPSGQFGDPLTRKVGSAPSDIAFADLDGSNNADIVVSDQASGDFSVLFNDFTPGSLPTFSQQYRYRAGAGLFDIDDSTGRQTVLSQLLTLGVVAGDFTGRAGNDLVVLNRGGRGLTLLPSQGQEGAFADPPPGDPYPTSALPGQIVKLTLPGDALPSVAVLMLDLHQIWIYRNNNQGGFDAPVKIDAGSDPSGFSVQTIDDTLALLVGNAYGDVLTLLYDGNLNDANGGFAPDRSGLNGVPLAVGMTTAGQEYAVVANQQLDKAYLYYRINGTTQFRSPVVLTGAGQLPLLAPGAVQIFSIPGDANHPYLVVANSLGNDVLLYRYDPASGGFDLVQTPIAVGDDPVSITVADVNGDGVPDLLVANKGSNDVSVLIGSTATGVWSATPYQRLNSGGLGPLSVAVQNTGAAGGPGLLITNSDGTVTALAGIGSGGKGSGFFQDAKPQPITLGLPIVNAVTDPRTGQTFVVGGDGSLGLLTGDSLTRLAVQNVADLIVVGDFLVAGFDNGSVGLLSTDGTLLADAPTGFADISALEALQNGDEVDVFCTEAGQDAPVLLPFFVALITEPPTPGQTAQGTGLPGFDLVLVATLLPGNLMESVSATVVAAPAEETFALFLSAEGGGADDIQQGQEAVVEVTAFGADASEVPALEQYVLGVADALEQRLKDQQVKDTVEDFLDALKADLDQFFKAVLQSPAALLDLTEPPAPPAVEAAGGEPGEAPVVWECAPQVLPPMPPQVPAPPAPGADVFTCVELLPAAAPVWPPEAHNGPIQTAMNAGPVFAYLAWRLGQERRRPDGELGRKDDPVRPRR